jgi:tetratricopeptide (TPR) repeat protein
VESDRYGLPLSTASREAAKAYREGIDLHLSGYPGAEQRLLQALAADEGFALAHAALARHRQLYGRMAEARASIARARALGGSAREQGHIGILGLLLEGQPDKALEALLRHLDEFPRDALPLSLALGAFGLYGFSGRADCDEARLALCRRMAPHYGEDWWFLTHLGWSHTEAGKLGAGQRLTQRALELRRENAHAAHAMAHFFVEADEPEDAADFLDDWMPAYDPAGILHSHLHWHRTLWRLQAGDLDAAHENLVRPAKTSAPPLIAFSDAASLLWRLELAGRKCEWSDVHAYAAERFPGTGPHFVEWHRAMAAAGAGDLAALDRQLAALPEMAPGAVLRSTCAAFRAFAAGDYNQVVALLEPVTADFARMGGSRAQRAVLLETLRAARRRLRQTG